MNKTEHVPLIEHFTLKMKIIFFIISWRYAKLVGEVASLLTKC